ncbi:MULTISPECIES: DUF4224 domain-containing protein [unclassified Pseudomonas]|uniref:DUF4224 domain-containing protein n=1 Tax=unclassified Pseudomonas TaxID=196821 RepID=UPI001B32D8D3|nr:MULTISPECIES: DUF4224 domain-containing protein [unclassified Pseudomonas]MDT9644011.1 DUF4224 domain-containing protein [Pseudomonas sp. JV245A]
MTTNNALNTVNALQSETLDQDELHTITGYQLPSKQIQWLTNNHWEFVLTGARRPIVGRVYARMKLAGVKPSAASAVTEAWSLNLANVS